MSRRSWKRIAAFTAAFGFTFTAGAYAQDIVQRVDAYLRPDFNVVVDGKPVQLAHSTLIYNDSSYLPLKELAETLGAVVNWKSDTKTIYINSRINPEQQETSEDITYDDVKMTSPSANYVTYLGGSYVLLQFYGVNGTYYRESDLRKMGVDTNGLQKVRDVYTKWIFISESEVKKRWKEQPKQDYTLIDPSGLVTTEQDPVKLKKLQDYVAQWKSYNIGNQYYYQMPIVIDKLEEPDQYRYLVSENNHFYFVYLTLKLFTSNGNATANDYLINSTSKEDIQAGYPDSSSGYTNNSNPYAY
jgi:hypothetical protein